MENIINGLISGYIGAIIVYPIDFIKTHIQNNIKLLDIKFKNMYRGSFIQLIGIGPEKTIKLFVNDKLTSNGINPILSGACAGCCQVLVTNPIEYIKIQYQMNLHKHMNFSKMFHGVQLCLARDIPFSAIYFPTYFLIKSKLDGTSPIKYFISGLSASLPAAYLVTPMDVIKTRMQTNPVEYKYVINTIQTIYKKEGFSAFWKGGYWRMAKSGPQFAITITIYEMLNFKQKN